MGTESWIDARGTDKTTHAANVIDYPHHEIHEGDAFTFTYTTTTANTDNHRTAIAFFTPNTTKWIHLVVATSVTGAAEVFILEAPTTLDVDKGTNGATTAPKNRNRNDTGTSGVLSNETAPAAGEVTTYTEAQIVIADGGADFVVSGTTLFYSLLGAGQGAQGSGGETRDMQEFVLKQNTLYMILIQNVGASANTQVINTTWYEHTNI